MANEKRLIDANALKTKVFNLTLYVHGLRFGKTVITNILESYRRGVFEEIDNAPTVDAVEVVHGHWEYGKWENGHWVKGNERCRCSVCHRDFAVDNLNIWHGCPQCLAKMDGGNEDA